MLRSLGYAVETVSSGEDGVAYLAENGTGLPVLDMVMFEMDGAETYRRVRDIQPGQRTIIVSGYSESVRVLEARRMGVGSYLHKPNILEQLGRAVRAELDREPAA